MNQISKFVLYLVLVMNQTITLTVSIDFFKILGYFVVIKSLPIAFKFVLKTVLFPHYQVLIEFYPRVLLPL